MRLNIVRNRNDDDSFRETSNCEVYGLELEVEFVISHIEKNTKFISHHCPENIDEKTYSNGFDIPYWQVDDLKKAYKKAKKELP